MSLSSIDTLPSLASLPPAEKVAANFSLAASTYDKAARLQQEVADKLLALYGQHLQGQVMDLGCGTGYVTQKLLANAQIKRVTALDISPAMLDVAKHKLGKHTCDWLQGDAQTLPMPQDYFNGIISSLTVQWCADLSALFRQLNQSLVKDGQLVFSTLLPGSLQELRQAWQAIDDYQHVNEFTPLATVLDAMQGYFYSIKTHTATHQVTYATLPKLLQALKRLGVSNHNQGAAKGLTTPAKLKQLANAYTSQHALANGCLPLSYQVVYIHAQAR